MLETKGIDINQGMEGESYNAGLSRGVRPGTCEFVKLTARNSQLHLYMLQFILRTESSYHGNMCRHNSQHEQYSSPEVTRERFNGPDY